MSRYDTPTVSFAELDEDSHAVFKRFRRQAPFVTRTDGARIVLRAGDVRRLGSDPRLPSKDTLSLPPGRLHALWKSTMLFVDGEIHARRRAPFTKQFSFPVMARLRSEVAATAHAVIDGWKGLDRMELVESFAARLPLLVVSRILGLPEADVPRVMSLILSVTRQFNGAAEIADFPQIEHDARVLTDGIQRLMDARRRSPRNDFLSTYLTSDAGASLTPFEAVTQIAAILIASTETTRSSIAALVVLLLEHRDQWDAVVHDPAYRRPAVIEALRVEPGVAFFSRQASEDVAIDGFILPAGSSVILSALSAMRDEAVFEEPDRFDIFRKDLPKSLIAFGAGPHRCLGEALTLLVMEEGLGALTSRLPNLRLAGPRPIVFGSASFRRITPVLVSWH